MPDAPEPTQVFEKKVTPGWKTSEFWFAGSAQLLGYIVGLGIIPTDSIYYKIAGFLLAGLASLGYSVSRGNTKS